MLDHRAWELLAAPLLMLQGRRVRRDTPVLPEAAGERSGFVPSRYTPPPAAGAQGEPPAGPPLRVLVAGDSSAAGVGVGLQRDAVSGCLVRALAGAQARPVDWRLLARSGLTASGLLELLREAGSDDTADCDLIVVVVGVNDVTGRSSRRAWLGALRELSDWLRAASPRARLLWSGLPPMHRFPALPQPLRAYLGARARSLDRALATWVAGDARMRHLPIPDLQGEGLMADDGFHPGPAGHRLWAEALAGESLNWLGRIPDQTGPDQVVAPRKAVA